MSVLKPRTFYGNKPSSLGEIMKQMKRAPKRSHTEEQSMRKSTRLSRKYETENHPKYVDAFVSETETESEPELKTKYENKKNYSVPEEDPFAANTNNLSEYEKMVQANIEERRRFLKELNIEEAKASLQEVLPQKKKVASYKAVKKIKNENPVTRRRSVRLMNVEPVNFSSLVDVRNDSVETIEDPLPDPGPKNLRTYADEEEDGLFEESLRDLVTVNKSSVWSVNSERLKDQMRRMKNPENCVAKVVPGRIYCIKVHPTISKTLIFVGDRSGYLGIWDACSKQKENIHNYKIHARCINCLSIDRFNSNNVYTNSYDGSFRRLDLNTSTVEQIYKCDEDYVLWHCQRDANCFFVCGTRGSVDYIDVRESKVPLRHFKVNDNKNIKLITSHPVQEHLVASGAMDGKVCLWDLKNMKSPLSEVDHWRTVSGLEFSPVSGRNLLSTCRDNYLRVIECSSGKLEVMNKIPHDNDTNRFVTTFRPSFFPQSDTHFVIGSKRHPRTIEVFNINGTLVHNFQSDQLASIASVNSVHPFKRVLAGGNASGKVYIFQDEQEFQL